jgi:glycosyltransferase involved in cell wall biosynthesis
LVKSDLFFLPSFTEGISNSMIEAICVETPVLISRSANTSQVIENNVSGFEFVEFDSENVSVMINEIKKLDVGRIYEITSCAKKKIDEEFSSSKVLSILESVL